jgi:hypothetical protein
LILVILQYFSHNFTNFLHFQQISQADSKKERIKHE